MVNNDIDLEKFSEKEITNYKKLIRITLVILILSLFSVISFILIKEITHKKSFLCNDTGLYRSILDNNVYIVGTEGIETKYSVSGSEIEEISRDLSTRISLLSQGNELNFNNLYISSVVRDKINKYSGNLINKDINLSDLFNLSDLVMIEGDICYTIDYIQDGKVHYKNWVIESNGKNNITEVSFDDIPNEIKESCTILPIGYIDEEGEIEDFVGDSVIIRDNEYFLDLYSINIENENTISINFFGDRIIDLMELEPSKELRQLNPGDRFTWIMEDSVVDGDWCTCYFSNKYYDGMSEIRVRVKENEVVDIEIIGFED